ncbi:hypothetical protein OROHE_024514 [Orobanche hederae]
MYSRKQNYLSAYLCVILYVTSLINAVPGTGGYCHEHDLSYDYYDRSCPNLQTIVGWGVWKAIQNETRMAASLLRLQFHDCFVNLGGPFWKVSLGRLDGLTANKQSVMEQLPSTFAPLQKIIAQFVAKGLDIKDVVVLSGLAQDALRTVRSTVRARARACDHNVALVALVRAHTLGFAQCFNFMGRLYDFNRTGKPDPCLAPSLLSSLRETCGKDDGKSAFNLVPLDPKSESNFDNKYYTNILKNEGLLQSDQILMSARETAALVEHYSKDLHGFLNDFAESMVKLGSLDVITGGGGGGEVRQHCGCVNT